MKTKALILSMALAGLALGGCGRLGELERPGARDAPIPGSNPK
jgi:predicted small lipoprotein YifL